MALVKNPGPMMGFEETVYNVSISHLSSPIKNPPLFKEDFKHPICIPKASVTGLQGIYTKTSEDMDGFKESMSRYLGLNIKYSEKCPPSKTNILIRLEPVSRFNFNFFIFFSNFYFYFLILYFILIF